MEQEKTKDEILSELYSIRATMSLVSENDDRAADNRSAVANGRREMYRKDEQINSLHKQIAYKEQLIQSEQASYRESLEKILMEEREQKEKYWERSKNRLPYMDDGKFIFLIIFMVAGIIAALIGGLAARWGKNWEVNDFRNIIIMIAVAGVPILCFVCTYIYDLVDGRKLFANMFAESVDKIAAVQKLLKWDVRPSEVEQLEKAAGQGKLTQIREEIGTRRAEIRGLNEQIDQLNAEKMAIPATFAEDEKKIQLIAMESKEIIDNAVKAYPVIDFRDWENTDLLIFHFETGRAESLKEALQLVDRQRQTDRIADAIDMATSAIKRTIQQSMSALGIALSISFDRLSKQFEKQHTETMGKFEQQAELLNETGELSKIQISNQAMANALLAKIDKSSAALAEDMKRQLQMVHGIY